MLGGRVLGRILPDRLSHWLVALVIGGILLTQALALSLYHADRMRALEAAQSRQAAECVAGFAQLLKAESPAHRRMMMRPLMLGHRMDSRPEAAPGINERHGPEGSQPEGSPPGGTLPDGPPSEGPPPEGMHAPDGTHPPDGNHPPPNFLIHLPPMGEHGPPPFGEPRFFAHIQAESILPDGTRLTLDAPQPLSRFLTPTFAAYIAAVMAVGMIGSIWSVSLATKPLSRLSEAADRFGADVHAPPVAETGPREVKQAAAAFNRMQRRLRQFVTDRTRMLAAISHDLRTPLTRMRLRLELLRRSPARDALAHDLADIESIASSVIDFAKFEVTEENAERIDFWSLVESVADSFEDASFDEDATPSRGLICIARPVALRRCITNLIQNAVTYGKKAHLGVRRTGDTITLSIRDEGPGIPQAKLDAVFGSFVRLEESRNRTTGGLGLGLTIARNIARGAGGEVDLSNYPGGGLLTELRLPVAA